MDLLVDIAQFSLFAIDLLDLIIEFMVDVCEITEAVSHARLKSWVRRNTSRR